MDVGAIQSQAREANALIQRGRKELVSLVRAAYSEGLPQREIARLIGRSQPEVNRLIRFHGTSPNGKRLRQALPEIKNILRSAGLSNLRVFGSTANETDGEDSDIDLLVTAEQPLGYLAQERIRSELSDAVGVPIDLVFDHAIRPDFASRILNEAIPL